MKAREVGQEVVKEGGRGEVCVCVCVCVCVGTRMTGSWECQ
jgi:hypothetical protein